MKKFLILLFVLLGIVGGFYFIILQTQRVLIRSIAFSPEDKMIVCGGGDIGAHSGEELNGKIWVLNTSSGSLIYHQKGIFDSNIYYTVFSPNGKNLLLYNKYDDKAFVLNTLLWKHTNLPLAPIVTNSLKYVPSQNRYWLTKDQLNLRRKNISYVGKVLLNHSNEGLEIDSLSPLANSAIITDKKGSHYLWNNHSPALRKFHIPEVFQWKTSVFSADGQVVALAGKGGVKIINVSTQRELETLHDNKSTILLIAFSNNKKFVAGVDSYNNIYLWELGTKKLLFNQELR